MIKIIAHDTNMKIPIFNSMYNDNEKIIKNKSLNKFKKLNNLNFKKIRYIVNSHQCKILSKLYSLIKTLYLKQLLVAC